VWLKHSLELCQKLCLAVWLKLCQKQSLNVCFNVKEGKGKKRKVKEGKRRSLLGDLNVVNLKIKQTD
jgi:hypothetical protein